MTSNGTYLFGQPHSVKGMRLQVSANGRYLMDEDGRPFFYLADTAWSIFKRLTHDEVELYLQNRAAKGFNAIQAYVLRGLHAKNLYGQLPLVDGDPTKPNEAFFQNVDYVINRANELGLVMGCVVCYGQHVRDRNLHEQIFTPENARSFGQFLGHRYKDNCITWYLGGDEVPTETQDTWTAMGLGLKDGSDGLHLVSYHGPGSRETPSSSYWFHDAAWLDFNTIQSGHGWTVNSYDFVTHDFHLTPAKPTIDMEASYENHPDVRSNTGKRMDAHQVREFIYWNILAGAAGHGYGCHDIWSFYDEAITPTLVDKTFYSPDYTYWRFNTHWQYALNFMGAYSMGLARKLFELRPWYLLTPDQSVIADGQGEGEDHVQAAIAEDGSFLLAYLTLGHPISIHMDRLTGASVIARWYNPRDGHFIDIAQYPNTGIVQFTPPTNFDRTDWVLVLEDACRNYPTSLCR